MPEPTEIFPLDMGRGKGKSNPKDKDFRPRPVVALEDTTDPTDIELAMLEEQIAVAAELGIEPDQVNPPVEVDDPESHRPRERSKPA